MVCRARARQACLFQRSSLEFKHPARADNLFVRASTARRELERLLGRETMEVEILKEALMSRE